MLVSAPKYYPGIHLSFFIKAYPSSSRYKYYKILQISLSHRDTVKQTFILAILI